MSPDHDVRENSSNRVGDASFCRSTKLPLLNIECPELRRLGHGRCTGERGDREFLRLKTKIPDLIIQMTGVDHNPVFQRKS